MHYITAEIDRSGPETSYVKNGQAQPGYLPWGAQRMARTCLHIGILLCCVDCCSLELFPLAHSAHLQRNGSPEHRLLYVENYLTALHVFSFSFFPIYYWTLPCSSSSTFYRHEWYFTTCSLFRMMGMGSFELGW